MTINITRKGAFLLQIFFHYVTSQETCSILSTSIHNDVATDLAIHDHIKTQNREYFRYKPEFGNGKTDYAVLQGQTSRITSKTYNSDKAFEFCARYKGALTYYKGKFYCCGGTSAYFYEDNLYEEKDFPKNLTEKGFSPCFSREADFVKNPKNTIQFQYSINNLGVKKSELGWETLYGPNGAVYNALSMEHTKYMPAEKYAEKNLYEYESLTPERMEGKDVYGMYQHFIHLNDELYMVNYRNRVFKMDTKNNTFIEIEFNKMKQQEKYYLLRDRLMCTIIHDRSKYVCLVHDLTDQNKPKEERKRRALYYLFEIWSVDKSTGKLEYKDHFLDMDSFEGTTQEASLVNNFWPNLGREYDNKWTKDVEHVFQFEDDFIEYNNKTYKSKFSGKYLKNVAFGKFLITHEGLKYNIFNQKLLDYNEEIYKNHPKCRDNHAYKFDETTDCYNYRVRDGYFSLSKWWLKYGIGQAYPFLRVRDDSDKIDKTKLEYIKNEYPKISYRFWQVIDVPTVLGFEACSYNGSTTFKLRMKKSFGKSDIDAMFEYAETNSMYNFTNFNTKENDKFSKLAKKCFIGDHDNFHTIIQKFSMKTLGLVETEMNQCRNLCSENHNDSWVDHTDISTSKIWEMQDESIPENIAMKDLHKKTNYFARTICTWGNSVTRTYRTVVIDKDFLGIRGCFPEDRKSAEMDWIKDENNSEDISSFSMKFSSFLDLYKTRPDPFKNQFYEDINITGKISACEFVDTEWISPPNKIILVVMIWIVTLVLIFTCVWNFNAIVFKLKFKKFKRTNTLTTGVYFVLEKITKGQQGTAYFVENEKENNKMYVIKCYPREPEPDDDDTTSEDQNFIFTKPFSLLKTYNQWGFSTRDSINPISNYHSTNLSTNYDHYNFDATTRLSDLLSSSNYSTSKSTHQYTPITTETNSTAGTTVAVRSDFADACKIHDIDSLFPSKILLKDVLKDKLREVIQTFNFFKKYKHSSIATEEEKSKLLAKTINETTKNGLSKNCPEYYETLFENELQILALTQSEFVPNVVECYSNMKMENLSFQWNCEMVNKKDSSKPRLCYFVMSMEGTTSWDDHVTINNFSSIQKNLQPHIFNIKSHMTIQILKALQMFQHVSKYSLMTKLINKEHDMHPRFICHSDLHGENIRISDDTTIYKNDKITQQEIDEIKVVIIDFGCGIIVKNRFETYKDYHDVYSLLKKLWYGDEMSKEAMNMPSWNDDKQEFLWLFKGDKLPDLDPNLKEKVKLMQKLLSEFTKIERGMRILYGQNCQSRQFREMRETQQDAENATFLSYYQPYMLINGEQLSKRVPENDLIGYERVVENESGKLSMKYLGEIIDNYEKALNITNK